MNAQDIIECIMTMHWDLAACNCKCWVCEEGWKLGYHPVTTWENWRGKYGLVSVAQTNK